LERDHAGQNYSVPNRRPARRFPTAIVTFRVVTGQRLRIGIVLGDRLFHQAHRLVFVRPGLQGQLGQSAPPRCVSEAQRPLGMGLGHLLVGVRRLSARRGASAASAAWPSDHLARAARN
jgi:hypothetical protein